MPSYLAFCEDKADTAALREQLRGEHLVYIETVMDRIRVAGPLREDGSDTVVGSMLIYRGASLDEVRAILENDPYYRAGIWASVRWLQINPVAGEWVGGKNW